MGFRMSDFNDWWKELEATYSGGLRPKKWVARKAWDYQQKKIDKLEEGSKRMNAALDDYIKKETHEANQKRGSGSWDGVK